MRRDRGFTLIEILVAVVVLAIMAVAAYAGLNAIIHVRESSQQSMQQFQKLQIAMVTLTRDLQQAIARPIRHASGDIAPGMLGSDNNVPVLLFTRNGRPNPLQKPRSSLERIAYGVDGDQLVRYSYPVLDRTVESTPLRQVLLKNVTAFTVSFMDQFGQVSPNWPPLNSEAHKYDRIDPVAITVTLDTKRWGKIKRVIGIAP
ncbi:MAG: type II secretion system minor pseudopilin GspJ [Gammaproteobacteria bacterium]